MVRQEHQIGVERLPVALVRLLAMHHIEEVLRGVEILAGLDRLLALTQAVIGRGNRREADRELQRLIEGRLALEPAVPNSAKE
jgi:hypothetical protein